MSDRAKGNTALLLTALVWGSGFVAQRLGNEILPPMSFNSIRQIMAGLVLLPVLTVSLRSSGYLSREKASIAQISYRRRKALIGGLICGLFMLSGSMLQQIGLVTLTAGKSGFISSIYIVFVPIFSVILGNHVKRRSIFCVIMAMAGFGVMSLQGGLGTVTTGDWLTLLSAASFAAQIVAVNNFLDRNNDILLSVIQMFFCGITGFTVALFVEHPQLSAVIEGLPLLLYMTFFPTAAGFTLQIVGQKYTDSSSAALIMSLESVFALI
ncbi:MAG: DMT family transporter, partial [Mogibacterium sp.]|nr:DMT family transporter [Mogibacterium sp.]